MTDAFFMPRKRARSLRWVVFLAADRRASRPSRSRSREIRAAGYTPFSTDIEIEGRTAENVLLDSVP
jgi:hypothetical protein